MDKLTEPTTTTSTTNITRRRRYTVNGAAIGALIGYPLSYYFQPEALRLKVPLGKYIQHISDVFGDKDLRSTAIVTWIVAIIVCAVIGSVMGQNADQKQKP